MVSEQSVVTAVVLSNAVQLASATASKLLGGELASTINGQSVDSTALDYLVVAQLQKALTPHLGD